MNTDELRKLQTAEAVKRMKKLRIMKQPIKEFEEDGKLNLSEYGGILYWLSDEEQKMVDDFENKYNSVVYHVVKSFTEFGLLYSLLYVSEYTDEWEKDVMDIEKGQALVYVENMDDPYCSEFGTIGITPLNGGVARIW